LRQHCNCHSLRTRALRSGTDVVERAKGLTGRARNEAIATLVTALNVGVREPGLRTGNERRRVGSWTDRVEVINYTTCGSPNACCSMTLRLGCWRRKTTRFRSGAHRGTEEVAERPSQAPNGSAARLRESMSRDERVRRETRRAKRSQRSPVGGPECTLVTAAVS